MNAQNQGFSSNFLVIFKFLFICQVGTTSWLTNFLLLSPQRDLYRGGSITSSKLHTLVPGLFRPPKLTHTQLR